MSKYLSLAKYELKTITRDAMNLYMLVSPLFILALSAYGIPALFNSMSGADPATLQITMLLLVITIIAISSYILAAMGTFLLLDHKDENTLKTIAVTPLTLGGYLRFKLSYIYIMSIISTVIILLGTKLLASDAYIIGSISLFDNISVLDILLFSIVSSIIAPVFSLLQSAFAKNKVEGLAFVKGTGIVAILPVIMVLETFQGGLQYILGIFPNFWALKGILLQLFPNGDPANLPYAVYLGIGAVFSLTVLYFAYKAFIKKADF